MGPPASGQSRRRWTPRPHSSRRGRRCGRCATRPPAAGPARSGRARRRLSSGRAARGPGDREDREGRPFAGPAGRELDRALAAAEIARRDVYVTNVVKHFKFEGRGKRRIHQRPSAAETAACRPWLEAELAAVRPELVVALGATAARALLGSGFRVTRDRGVIVDSRLGVPALGTIHPSAIPRAPDEAARREERRRLTADLRVVARALR